MSRQLVPDLLMSIHILKFKIKCPDIFQITNTVKSCRNNYVFLWNGRMKGDYCTPMITRKHCSTVDYFLSSNLVFENVVHFKVDELCNLRSDIHAQLYVKNSVHDNYMSENKSDRDIKTKTWDSKTADLFIENIDIIKSINKLKQTSTI